MSGQLNRSATWSECRATAEDLGDVGGGACLMAESLGFTPAQISGVYVPERVGGGLPFQLTFGRWQDGEPFVIVSADGASDPEVLPGLGGGREAL